MSIIVIVVIFKPPVLMLRCRLFPHHVAFRMRQEGISAAGASHLVTRGLPKAGFRRTAEVCQAGKQMG